jgi:hypothetical protein
MCTIQNKHNPINTEKLKTKLTIYTRGISSTSIATYPVPHHYLNDP